MSGAPESDAAQFEEYGCDYFTIVNIFSMFFLLASGTSDISA